MSVHWAFDVIGLPAPGACCQDGVMPWIELEGAANARDLGGLPTTGGGKTVGGRLLRSDNLQNCRLLMSPSWSRRSA